MVTNNLEVRVVGLQRSGNHAVIFWIIDQFKGKRICFLNNVCHGDRNPFLTAEQTYSYNMEEVPENELHGADRDILVYSYEDTANLLQDRTSIFASVYRHEFESNRRAYLGESVRKIDVLIIRDPYNFFASRIKGLAKLTGVKDVETIAKYWKELARAVIKIEENPEDPRVVVNFNRWFADKQYRQELSRRFGGVFSDDYHKNVPVLGGGSSFDKIPFNGDFSPGNLARNLHEFLKSSTYQGIGVYLKRLLGGKQMNVLERWREMQHEPQFVSIMQDPEIKELSEKIFGDLLHRA